METVCSCWGSPKVFQDLVWCVSLYYLLFFPFFLIKSSLVAELVKNPPALQETLIQSLGWEDPLEKETATHSSILAYRIPMQWLPC